MRSRPSPSPAKSPTPSPSLAVSSFEQARDDESGTRLDAHASELERFVFMKAASDPSNKLLPSETSLAAGGEFLAGDNMAALHEFESRYRGQVTLAYLDPPFFTGRTFDHKDRASGTRELAFDDRWADRDAYLAALGARIRVIRELLAPHGSIIIHVDPKTSHYVKVMCDQIFGEACFASEIVWRYRRWPSKTDNFQRVHDVLLRYRKDANVKPRWNALFEPLAASTQATWGTKKQRAVFSNEGKRLRSSTEASESQGVPMGDVWEIGILAPMSSERTGYPSQKPEALLERIVRALSSEGDLVLDPYAGSGTTLAVAARLGRRFLGADASPISVRTVRARLEALKCTLHMSAKMSAHNSTDPSLALGDDLWFEEDDAAHLRTRPPHAAERPAPEKPSTLRKRRKAA
jgi:DNA modification methylase